VNFPNGNRGLKPERCRFSLVSIVFAHFIVYLVPKLYRSAHMSLANFAVSGSRVISRSGLFGSGRAQSLRLSKCFEPFSGLHTKPFHNIQSNEFFRL